MTIDRSDFRYIPIGPSECPHCFGVRHWPHECPNQPEAIEKRRREAAEIMRKIVAFSSGMRGENK